jgi:hypothetical protein
VGSIPITRSSTWQLVERVPGADDAGGNAHIAQSVEHFLGKEEVTGSNPVMGSIIMIMLEIIVGCFRPEFRFKFVQYII